MVFASVLYVSEEFHRNVLFLDNGENLHIYYHNFKKLKKYIIPAISLGRRKERVSRAKIAREKNLRWLVYQLEGQTIIFIID